MEDHPEDLVQHAEELLRERKLGEGARCLEEAAGLRGDGRNKAGLFRKAAHVYGEVRATEDAGRCYRNAARLLESEERAACLLEYWKLLILEIAGCLYDCGFEWRGDVSGGHDADHRYYQETIEKHKREAEDVLAEALKVDGVNREALLREAKEECKERAEDGWGASQCQDIIKTVLERL